jgi:anti-sigma B factor antagonist
MVETNTMSPVLKVFQPVGILDGTKAPELRNSIELALRNDANIVLIDLAETTFIDSSGLGALVNVLKLVRAQNGRFCLCSPNPQVRMVFELSSMDQAFEVFADRDAFEAAIH